MPRTLKASSTTATPKPRAVAERKRTPVRKKAGPPLFDPAEHHDEIAQAAYLSWLERGGADSNPEADWFLAEQTVRAKYVN